MFGWLMALAIASGSDPECLCTDLPDTAPFARCIGKQVRRVGADAHELERWVVQASCVERVVIPEIMLLIDPRPMSIALQLRGEEYAWRIGLLQSRSEDRLRFSGASRVERPPADRTRGDLEAGTWSGPYAEYSEDGKILEVGRLSRGLRHGYWRGSFADGSAAYEGAYLDGERVGTWTIFHGPTRTSGSYHLGRQVGQWTQYADEQLVERGTYDNGRPVGRWVSWHPNGRKQDVRTFRGGNLHGRTRTWDVSGALRKSRQWDHGEPTGTWTAYTADGQLLEVGEYLHGRRTGTWNWYYPSGTRKESAQYWLGELHGQRRTWAADGALLSSGWFDMGRAHEGHWANDRGTKDWRRFELGVLRLWIREDADDQRVWVRHMDGAFGHGDWHQLPTDTAPGHRGACVDGRPEGSWVFSDADGPIGMFEFRDGEVLSEPVEFADELRPQLLGLCKAWRVFVGPDD